MWGGVGGKNYIWFCPHFSKWGRHVAPLGTPPPPPTHTHTRFILSIALFSGEEKYICHLRSLLVIGDIHWQKKIKGGNSYNIYILGSYWTKGSSWLSWSHHFEGFTIATMTWFTLRNICVTNDHGYVPFVVNTSQSFPHSWLITGFVTRLTRRVPLVEQKPLTLPEHLNSPRFFVGFLLLDL